ncbi:helix-turn-helix domain-containing protein [Roseateles sp.]|uniref:helix-turn-helix domain-containing protein n=1 Tax=Roseateles sp. TaxID=1971397 RepID=UPI0031DF130C
MSVKALSIVFDAPIRPPTNKLLAAVMADWCDDRGGSLFPSMSRIAEKVGISRSQAQRIVHSFMEQGLLSVVANGAGGKPGMAPHYRLHLERIAALAETGGVSATGRIDATGSAGAQEGSHGCAQGVAPMHETGRTDATLTTIEPLVNHHVPVKARKCGDDSLVLPDWISQDTWRDFEQMRKSMRKPMTSAASRLIVKKLGELREQGQEPQRVLEQSIQNSWVGVFPLKGARGTPASRPSRHSGFDELDYSKGVGDDGSLN